MISSLLNRCAVLALTALLAPASALSQNVDLAAFALTDGIRIDGEANSVQAGRTVSSAGDFNGDGFGDVLISSSYSAHNSRVNSGSYAVVFGGESGLTNVDMSSLGSRGFWIDGNAANNFFGDNSCATGDVNGDGYSDVILGNRYADFNGTDAGACFVIFGKGGPTFSDIDLNALSPTDGFRIAGATTNDQCGNAVNSGDVNGDGYDDVVLCSIYSDIAGSNAGTCHVIYGKSIMSNIDLSVALPATDGFRIVGSVPGDEFGSNADCADLNGDGYDDLVVGAWFSDLSTFQAGTVYVLFGKATGQANVGAGSIASPDGFRMTGIATDDHLGVGISRAGDVNGDGLEDVSIGTDGADFNSRANSGSVYVVFGRYSPFASSFSIGTITATTGFRVDGSAAGDVIGLRCATAGDYNHDGYTDVLLSTHLADNNSRTNSGSAYVVYGKGSGIGNVDLANMGSNGFRIDGAVAGDNTGSSIASVGDVNGDDFSELIIGGYLCGNNGRAASGSMYVVYGGKKKATYVSHLLPGDLPKSPIGVVTKDAIPASQVWIDYSGGDAPSTDTVTLYSLSRSPVTGITPRRDINDTIWQVTTTRTGWASAALTIRYPKSAQPIESDLRIFKAENPAGPWTRLDTTLNAVHNEATAQVTSFSWFALGKSNVLPLGLSEFEVE